eukprot:1137486-Alexandrium_andersonii.AAC.1
MSASLVGSEMCIRDRGSGLPRFGSQEQRSATLSLRRARCRRRRWDFGGSGATVRGVGLSLIHI